MTTPKEAIEAAAWAIESEIHDLNERTFSDIAETALIAAEPHLKRVITTKEELDALPAFAVILLTNDGKAAPSQKDTAGEWRFPGFFESIPSEVVAAEKGTITLIYTEEES